ncbi:MAG: 30S ribosomal protein S17 [Candidatus Caldarchaeum sp.]|nr:30S ribosomal protein S17 [Candidatus Caldarchaeum sp.]
MSEVRNIGIKVKQPTAQCKDRDCPFHGKLSVRGIILTGVVFKKKMNKNIVIERETTVYVKKFKRYMRRRSRLSAHLPPCIDVEVGDRVKVGECRPLSKTVSFVVLEKVG